MTGFSPIVFTPVTLNVLVIEPPGVVTVKRFIPPGATIPCDVSPPSGTANVICVPSGLTVAWIGAAFIAPEVDPWAPGWLVPVHVTLASWRFVPWTTTFVPRAPDAGDTLVIVGASVLAARAAPPRTNASTPTSASMLHCTLRLLNAIPPSKRCSWDRDSRVGRRTNPCTANAQRSRQEPHAHRLDRTGN